MDITNNLIQIKNLKNETLDFDDKLSSNKSLLIKNSSNLKIIINSKINKITVENSNQIFISVQKLISGIEISDSKHVLISLVTFIGSDESISFIPCIELYKSELYLIGDKNKYQDIKITCHLSEIYQIEV